MDEKKELLGRGGFLASLAKAAAIATFGAMLLGGGCKCGDEDVGWSDQPEQGDDEGQPQPPPEPPPEGGGEGEGAGEGEGGS